MKQILWVVLLVMLAVPAHAQVSVSIEKLATGKAYAEAQIDTSREIRIAGANVISAVFRARDSVDVIRNFQYRIDGGTAWTVFLRDTLTSAVNAGAIKETVIRSPGTTALTTIADSATLTTTHDKIGGVSGFIRVIRIFGSAGKNGESTATYDDWIYYRP